MWYIFSNRNKKYFFSSCVKIRIVESGGSRNSMKIDQNYDEMDLKQKKNRRRKVINGQQLLTRKN